MVNDKKPGGALGRIIVRFFSSPLFHLGVLIVYLGGVDSKHNAFIIRRKRARASRTNRTVETVKARTCGGRESQSKAKRRKTMQPSEEQVDLYSCQNSQHNAARQGQGRLA